MPQTWGPAGGGGRGTGLQLEGVSLRPGGKEDAKKTSGKPGSQRKTASSTPATLLGSRHGKPDTQSLSPGALLGSWPGQPATQSLSSGALQGSRPGQSATQSLSPGALQSSWPGKQATQTLSPGPLQGSRPGKPATRPLSPGALPTPAFIHLKTTYTLDAPTSTTPMLRSHSLMGRALSSSTPSSANAITTPGPSLNLASTAHTPTPSLHTTFSIKLPSVAISESPIMANTPQGRVLLEGDEQLSHMDNLLTMTRQSLNPPSAIISTPHQRPKVKSPSRTPSRSPVRVPSGGGVSYSGSPPEDDPTREQGPLEVSGSHIPVHGNKRSSSVSSEEGFQNGGQERGEGDDSTPPGGRESSTGTPSPFKQRTPSPFKQRTLSPFKHRTTPPFKQGASPSPYKLAPHVVPIGSNDLDNTEEPSQQSDATRRLLDRWQITMNPSSTPVKPLTTVSLPSLNKYHSHIPPGFSGTPSLPSLAVRNPMSSSAIAESRNSSRGPRKDNSLLDSIFLGPDLERSSPANAMADLRSSKENCSFQMRMDYGKNLERNWYQNMVEKERRKASQRSFGRLVETHQLEGTMEDFYKSFYSSCSDTDDAPITFKDDIAGHRTDRKSPFIRYASTDVLYSEQSDNDEDSASDIEIILKDNAIYERRVKHKMRRKQQRREAKYQTLFGERSEDEEKLGRTDENGDLIFLPDTEIRALRLKLRTDDEDEVYNETCTIEELRAQVMTALDRLKGSSSKGKGPRKKRKSKRTGEHAGSRGYGDHKPASMYDRFLQEYGYLLDGYQVEQLSSSDSENEQMGSNSERVNRRNSDTIQTLPPIYVANLSDRKKSQGKSQGVRFSGHLPKLNHTYQASPFSQAAGLLIGDTYYAGGAYLKFDPTHRPRSQSINVAGSDQVIEPLTPRRKKKKQRLERVLKSLTDDGKLLLNLAQTEKAVAAPLSARRMSDPGVHLGKMLAKQKIIETEDENAASPVRDQRKSRKKRKTKKLSRQSGKSQSDAGSQGLVRPQERPQSSQGMATLEESGAPEDEFTGCKAPRRTQSARGFRAKKDRELTLRELTKDLDFPAKEVRIQVAERRLQRQRLRQNRRRRREEREQLDDEFREERRLLVAEAKAEYFRQLEKARAETARGDQGYHTEQEEGTGEEDHEGEEDDIYNERGGFSQAGRFARRLSKWRKRAEQLRPKPDYKELLRSPLVSACVSTSSQSNQRSRVQLPQEEIVEEAEDVSDLFLEMKNCRWIRWTQTQQRIIDRVEELEMEAYYNDEG